MSKETVTITLKPGFGAQRTVERPGLGKFLSGEAKECTADSGDLLKVRAMTMFEVKDQPAEAPKAAKKSKEK